MQVVSMRGKAAVLVILFCCAITAEPAAAAKQYPSDPLLAEIHYSDVDLFWMAFDAWQQNEQSNPFVQYLEGVSSGVRGFIPDRILSARDLLEMVQKEKDYYRSIRSSSAKAKEYEKQMRATYYAMKYWYPDAVFPPVYFVIGRTTSGGTDTPDGLVIGLETFADQEYKTNYGRPSIPIEYLPFVVAHELVHYLQKTYTGASTLLRECIREGSADFIGELIAGEKVKLLNNPTLYQYGDQHEAELVSEFLKQKDSSKISQWLYGQTSDRRPQNLGYWIGYKIVQSYFERTKDKRQAIHDILNVSDYEAFFAASGYPD